MNMLSIYRHWERYTRPFYYKIILHTIVFLFLTYALMAFMLKKTNDNKL